jgi:hypothetical protein
VENWLFNLVTAWLTESSILLLLLLLRSGREGREIKENDGGGEFNYKIL